jgi:hypothetical protein
VREVALQQHVVQLEVAVQQAALVEVLDGARHLQEDLGGGVGWGVGWVSFGGRLGVSVGGLIVKERRAGVERCGS